MRRIKQDLKYKVPVIKLAVVLEGRRPGKMQSIKGPEDAVSLLSPLRLASEEFFVSLHLNARHEVIGVHEVSHGTLSSSLVHPREVFKAALLCNSYSILVCHNHPSGSRLCPSPEDLDTTEQLLKAASLLGVGLLDHVIVGPCDTAYSIRENHPHLWS